MNRRVRKIVSAALIISAFSTIAPVTNYNFMITKVYAADGTLTSVQLEKTNGDGIKTYSDDDYKSKNEVDDNDITAGTTYYAKTSSKRIKISTSGVDSNCIRVFKGESSSTKGAKTSSSIDLSSGSTKTITIRTYSEDPGSSVKYDDTSKRLKDYKIDVKCTSSSSDDEKDGDVYLKSISLSDGDIDFSKSTTSYDVKVPESVSEIKITAKPDCDEEDYGNYEVTIDGETVNEDDKFKKTVSLDKGENEIKITVTDDNDNKRTYKLNVTRAKSSVNTSSNGNSNDTGVIKTTVKANQWVLVNGRWQYNDSFGRLLKSQWLFDRNYGKWYYLGADGNMLTGWILDGGKYYYLYTDGSMAANTVIGGYKVGSDGAWIGR